MQLTEVSVEPRVAGLDLEALRDLSRQRQEPEWLWRRREAAWHLYDALDWPSPTDEDWRRTDLRRLGWEGLRPAWQHPELPRGALPASLSGVVGGAAEAHGRLVLLNGRPYEHTLSSELIAQGVVFAPLSEAARTHPDLVERSLPQLEPSEGKFAALKAAAWDGAVFCHVPDGVEVSLPLEVVHGLSSCLALFSRLLVVLGRGARLQLVEAWAPLESGSAAAAARPASFNGGALDLFLGPESSLRYVALQRWSEDSTDLTSGHVRMGPRSQLNSLVIPMGGWLAKHDLRVDLAGEGSDAELLGLYCAHGDQNIDFHTRQMHMVPQTRSDLLYKGVLLGNSRVLYRGLIRAEPGAMKTDAYQANRNLVLSDTAKAEPMPMLEILANDLRCTHGATVGQVDRDMLFYLQSRGLPEEQAKLLVVNGFFEEMLQRIPLKHVREDLVKVIAAKVTR